ncbi:DUF1080 domain-containing protein [Polaribacter sp.]|uniref:3-keto-disaccharide hydrolase n=1 Tax=Polaribacter sp. TaxID=1920175 RepID=UPI0025CC858F|nr:DUF1080 domain-containing protein [Polaribacter sp.]
MKQIIYITILSINFCFLSCQDNKKKEFYSIFNGKNLEGWNGDKTYWSVKDGILIGEVTPETILKRNSFVIYEKEQPENFELKLEYRISTSGNSGVNYRSEKIKNKPFSLRGYQSDIDGKNKYTGQNYEEKKRTTLAYIGEKVIIKEMQDSIPLSNIRKNVKRNCWQTRDIVASLGDKKELKATVKNNDWNTMHIIANGNHMQHFVNGVLMSDVIDLDTQNRSEKGFIGVQVHVGPPMKIEYKNIRLRHLN